LAGHRTEVVDPISDHIDEWAGQALQPHQALAIDAAVKLVDGLRRRLGAVERV